MSGGLSESLAIMKRFLKRRSSQAVVPFLSWRLPERVGFRERGRGLSGSSKSELDVPAKRVSTLTTSYTINNLV